MSKSLIILSGIVGILVVITLVLFISSFQKQTPNNPPAIPTPSPIIVPNQNPGTQSVTATPTPVNIEKQNDTMINTIENRPTLQPSDEQAKQNILNAMPATSETVYTTAEFRIDYIRDPDVFQVEIDTTDVQKARDDAVAWFLSQGFSQQSICNLPVTFYLQFDVKQQLPDQGKNFNPLADNC